MTHLLHIWSQFMLSSTLRVVLVTAIVFLACMVTCTLVYGTPFANLPAFGSIVTCWLLVVIAVGDQIWKNWRSGRASGQLDPHVFISNWLENVAWIMFTWITEDPVYLITRFAGLWFDQIVYWQILASSGKARKLGKFWIFITYAGIPFAISLFALFGVPFFMSDILKSTWMHRGVSILLSVVWLYVATSWVFQIIRNRRVGTLSGRDFSLFIPVLIEIFLIAAVANEFFAGTHRIIPYVTLGTSLAINTFLLVDSIAFWLKWQNMTPEARLAEESRQREVEENSAPTIL